MQSPSELFIANQWRAASDGGTLDVIDPATEEVVAAIPRATSSDIAHALDAAEAGFRAWRAVDGWTRSRALRTMTTFVRDHLEDIARVLTEEQGKPLPEARGEVGAAADQLDWYADEARRIYGRLVDGHTREQRLMVMREPVGPVAAFVPWNFPCLLAARKLGPALAAGCSIITKPPEEAPRATLWLAKAAEAAELPPGVVGMLMGDPAHISATLIESPVIRKVTLTGSVPVGKELMGLCSRTLTPVTLELGGHSPVVVFADADVEEAAELCARGKFRNNGQVCICASRFFVEEPVMERFVRRFVEVVESLRIGDGRDEATDVGPLSNARRLAATEAFVADAVGKGATVAAGGKRPAHLSKGFYYEPTVLLGVSGAMTLMNEEPFCPVAPITSFRTLDEVLQAANDTPFGLAGYVFTTSTKTAFLAAEGLEVGMVGVNHLGLATAEAPFGGVKDSGFGREGGTEWVESYTHTKYVTIRL